MEHVKTFQHASAYTKEIKTLLKNVKYPANTTLIFQSLPKHMRRRAMSHYPKRLPKIYRKVHLSQMKKSGKLTQHSKKPKSKKLRKNIFRKKMFLLKTHIWHSKRFLMVKKWNCKIPFCPSEKSYRSCHKAIKASCLIQDISYYNCIEINGFLADIKDRFQLLTNRNSNLSICAKTFSSGAREGHVTLFQNEMFPRGALGEVNFMWKPCKTQCEKRTLWIWIHPSCYSNILNEIIKTFELVKFQGENASNDETSIISGYENKSTNLSLIELKQTFNRFRITGPRSQSVLLKILRPSKIADEVKGSWFLEAMQSSSHRENHTLQSQFWVGCNSEQILPNMVISLNVQDPRSLGNFERMQEGKTIENYSNFSEKISESFLWNSNIRQKLKVGFINDPEYNKIVRKTALISTEKMFENCLQTVPVILIQNPGSYNNTISKLGYGGGWDLIVPDFYSSIFWQSLLFCKVRVGGFREMQSIFKESGLDMFLPDTVSGKIESEERALILKSRHFKKPLNKRCNYNKLCISSPFKLPFNELVNEWYPLESEQNFFVLRDLESLQNISKSLLRKADFPNVEPGCLIQIYIQMKTKGKLDDLSIICIPHKEDLKCAKYKNVAYTEPLKNCLIKKSKNEEKKQRLVKIDTSKVIFKNKQNKKLYNTKMKNLANSIKNSCAKEASELWIIESPKCVRKQCSREVIGYVKYSNFSYIHSKIIGIGYVVAEGLKELVNTSKEPYKILVRGKTSRNYYVANFEIPINL
ncbi:ribonucleases P/MRP protein subunit POP1 [Condylostylus longicornis]|uniref:ribonucleases P/MRP protein subunit POP1 n=1 Tax=Condylostylus longicornis TaxID=2530218 RepID=UPI00244E15C5|nr:ribonucleases P/MRP protein subunit POP1 [Condylostylus longicornis]